MPDQASVRLSLPDGVAVSGELKPGYERVLTAGALDFVASLARRFEPQRSLLLEARAKRQAAWDGGSLPGSYPPGALRDYVCRINYGSIQPFPRQTRSGIDRIDNVEIAVAPYLRGRPWHPCDWRGLSTIEGWAQLLRFWMVKIGLPWDYQCGERGAFSGVDDTAARLCGADQDKSSEIISGQKTKKVSRDK